MNSVYIFIFDKPLCRLFPLRNVRRWLPRTRSASGVLCECAHTNASGHGIGCQDCTYIILYSDKHTSVHEEIEISPPNLSKGGSLRSPIMSVNISVEQPSPLGSTKQKSFRADQNDLHAAFLHCFPG